MPMIGSCTLRERQQVVKGILFLLWVCGFSMFSLSAKASPCNGIDRQISAEHKAALSLAISKQLNSDGVEVLRYFGADGWSIIYVDTKNSDSPFLFFKGSPGGSHYTTVWSGAAGISEEQAIRRWATSNAPGIPRRLAACFAWYVTPPHRDR
jgi:hypothetical protein